MVGWLQICRRCGLGQDLADPRWQCRCGGLLDLQGPAADPIGSAEPWSLWRYRSVLPFAGNRSAWERVTLGEGNSPLVPIGPGVWAKLDYVMPTGSFKDRGAAVMMSLAAGIGVERVVADSSGNAGVAVAAYAARAGLTAEIFVPEGTATGKVGAMEAFGAQVTEVGGSRTAAAHAAQAAARHSGAWYASHVYRPAFAHGVKTLAFEIWEQLGRQAPGTVVVPAGNGTLVQGLWLGFRQLVDAGHVRRVPPIVAVQSERCAPLAGLRPSGPTAAAGIAIATPPRAGQVRAAVVASDGRVITAAEDDLAAATADLARSGMRVEATAAAAWAAWRADPAGTAPVVVVLTGRG